jgi:hypothetical protein
VVQRISGRFLAAFAVSLCLANGPLAHALERVTYTSGMQDTFSHHEVIDDTVRFYKSADNLSWQDIKTDRIASIAIEADPQTVVVAKDTPTPAPPPENDAKPTMDEMKVMFAEAAAIHNVDQELLASIAKVESNFRVDARSKAGARGLMQLMPGTAKQMGVTNITRAEDNIKGGSAYLDQLLKQYHDDLALTLAAYNAGPGAVAKYHGIPPYRETQWYVVRVIREYNHRVQEREAGTMVASR